MSYLINEKASELICGFNSVDYVPPVAGGAHLIDTEHFSQGQLDSSSYEFKTNGGSYFCVCDFMGRDGGPSNQFFDCGITDHFEISEGYSVKAKVGGTINIDDGCYGRTDVDFKFITEQVRSNSDTYRGGLLVAKQTRLIGLIL